jgi:hypothetical protein
MIKLLKKLSLFPFHTFLFAVYPILALLANNLSQVEPNVVFRPLFISLAGATGIFLVLRLIVHSWLRAALITSFLLLLFFSYGQVYDLIRQGQIPGSGVDHSLLLPIYILLFAAGSYALLKKPKDLVLATRFLNVIGLALLLMPSYQIISFTTSLPKGEEVREKVLSLGQPLKPNPYLMPDIYVIVLDTYIRADSLQVDFGYDNTDFIEKLHNLGFYVADCSQGNFYGTGHAMSVLFNFNFYREIYNSFGNLDINLEDPYAVFIQDSQVRSQLEAIGYKTVSFFSLFPSLGFTDADVYYANPNPKSINPFEILLMNTTLIRVLFQSSGSPVVKKTADISQDEWEKSVLALDVHFRHLEVNEFTFAKLTEAIDVPGPKFVYAHFIASHTPFVYEPDCEPLTDPNYWEIGSVKPATQELLKQGYVYSIQCVNKRILPILEQIIAKSRIPPIIILMGDHGFEFTNNAQNILNAYYLPGDGKDNLYPTITPVNSFRLIFNLYFGTNYELLPDNVFNGYDQHVLNPLPPCGH